MEKTSITKHNVCLFIKDEEHLEEMREFLESKGEKVFKFINEFLQPKTHLDRLYNNNLRFVEEYGYWSFGYYTPLMYTGLTQVTTEQFKKLW